MWSRAWPWRKRSSGPEKYVYRSIPSIDKCLKGLRDADAALASVPQQLLKELAAAYWENIRERIKDGNFDGELSLAAQLPALLAFVHKGLKANLRPVFNAAGVIIHTNLGRSVLADEAREAVNMAARGYCNLEMDLATGSRGSRQALVSKLVCQLTGAEDALVVNNNAAAVLLILDSLCAGGETIVSRGELVEIGGSFRIPDIMRKGGTDLKEVGTTNRTHLEDYRRAISERTKAIMRVHASNFKISGFHTAVPLPELKKLAADNDLPLLFDLGSGSLLDFSQFGLPPEPTVREVVEQGADLVCFSGDKALGGPQAGIIAGRSDLVAKLKKNPLTRALRCDKLCLAALEATLRLYLDPEQAREAVPTPAMMTVQPEVLTKNARSLAAKLRQVLAENSIPCDVKLQKDVSRVGGGSFPECDLPTTLVCLYPESITAQALRERLLNTEIPLIGRLEKDAFCLDPRTLNRRDYPEIAKTLIQALADKAPSH